MTTNDKSKGRQINLLYSLRALRMMPQISEMTLKMAGRAEVSQIES